MHKLEVKWTQEKVTAIALSRGGSNVDATRGFPGKIFRTNDAVHRTRLIVISGRTELKANVTNVQRIAA